MAKDRTHQGFYARAAILDKIEELHDRLIAEERHRTDSGERISLDEMMRRYASDV